MSPTIAMREMLGWGRVESQWRDDVDTGWQPVLAKTKFLAIHHQSIMPSTPQSQKSCSLPVKLCLLKTLKYV